MTRHKVCGQKGGDWFQFKKIWKDKVADRELSKIRKRERERDSAGEQIQIWVNFLKKEIEKKKREDKQL